MGDAAISLMWKKCAATSRLAKLLFRLSKSLLHFSIPSFLTAHQCAAPGVYDAVDGHEGGHSDVEGDGVVQPP